MSGKGSNPRPFSVPKKKFDTEFDRIFNKKKDDETSKAKKRNDTDAR